MTATLTYQSGGVAITSATGAETVVVGNGGPQITTLTTQQIANLGGTGKTTVNTAITSTGATGTLTAAAIVGKLITRSGPTQAFTDTTDTAANIIAALSSGASIGQSFELLIKNTTAFAETISGGLGVTPSIITVIPAFMVARYLMTYTAAATMTMVGLELASISGTITDAIQNGNAQCTSSLSAQTNTVLANVTGLSVTVTAGATYNVRARLNGSAANAIGLKVAFSGTATATSSNVTGYQYGATSAVIVANQTTWGSSLIASNSAYTDVEISGSIVVANGGTITIAAAQNTSGATATTVLTGSTMTVDRVS